MSRRRVMNWRANFEIVLVAVLLSILALTPAAGRVAEAAARRCDDAYWVEVLIDHIPAFSVRLEVNLEVDFEGAVLDIAGGDVHVVKSASCRASGSVTCQDVVIASIKTGSMDLRNEIKLMPPFALRPSAAAALQAGLTLSGSDEAGRPLTFRLLPKPGAKEATWLIGRRKRRADFVIPRKVASAEHARIRLSSSRGMEICDLDSSNGTRLDGKRVDQSYISLAGARKMAFGSCEMLVSRLMASTRR